MGTDVNKSNSELCAGAERVLRALRDDPPTAGELVFDLSERELDWPSQPLSWERPASTPNVLVLVLDSLRGDMLTQENMPRTWAFSQNARVYEDHWSGGNCTRHGIFTLLYGLPGNYWEPTLRSQRSPVLLDVLQRPSRRVRWHGREPLLPIFHNRRLCCWATARRCGTWMTFAAGRICR